MADKQRGFIADNIRVAPKRYVADETEVKSIALTIDDRGTKDSYIARNNATLLYHALKDGFDWSKTNEGHDYWQIVAGSLYRISQKGR
jgi:hypothetical protein